MRQLEIRLLGRFEVRVDAHPVPAEAWPQRRAADLVKVLALASGHRMISASGAVRALCALAAR